MLSIPLLNLFEKFSVLLFAMVIAALGKKSAGYPKRQKKVILSDKKIEENFRRQREKAAAGLISTTLSPHYYEPWYHRTKQPTPKPEPPPANLYDEDKPTHSPGPKPNTECMDQHVLCPGDRVFGCEKAIYCYLSEYQICENGKYVKHHCRDTERFRVDRPIPAAEQGCVVPLDKGCPKGKYA